MKYILILVFSFSVLAQKKSIEPNQRYKNLELLSKVLYIIENQYYQEVDHKKLIEGAIDGMVSTLDPHSSYLSKTLMKKVKDDTEGKFGGLGIEVYRKDQAVYIVNALEDSPAEKAGIKPGDKIVEINKKSVIGLNFEEVIDKLQGKIGQEITLGVLRKDEAKILQFTMKRRIIKINPVQATAINESIAYIRLIQFQEDSGEEIEDALKDLKDDHNIKGIVLDLRNNPGGLLDEAVNVSSIFLNKGVVVSTEARDPSNKDIRYVKKSVYKDVSTPMVVLINGSSASASEIVAGALQDYGRALIVGSLSFGKGSVQSVAQIDGEVGIKLTIAQYLTPKKRKIQAIGIKPDVALQEIDLDWLDKESEPRRYIRESDLNNHLLAVKQEKKAKRKSKKSKLEIKLEKDFQVQQSIKLIDSAYFFKK